AASVDSRAVGTTSSSSATGTVNTSSTSSGSGATSCGHGTWATTGVATYPAGVGWDANEPSTASESTRKPTSSCVSRSAASTTVSPGSSLPPGKLISPGWWASRDERTVKRSSQPAGPSSSGTSTAARTNPGRSN